MANGTNGNNGKSLESWIWDAACSIRGAKDALTYFVLLKLTDEGIPNPEAVSRKVREAFARFSNWKRSEAELRELRKAVTFAIYAEEDDPEKVAAAVESLFTLLLRERRG